MTRTHVEVEYSLDDHATTAEWNIDHLAGQDAIDYVVSRCIPLDATIWRVNATDVTEQKRGAAA